MEQREVRIFPIEDALEIILMFDRTGRISYGNDTARKKLEYESDLNGTHISEIFPNTFRFVEGGFESDFLFGNEIQNLVAYRKNLTCFPVEARIMHGKDSSEMYICMANDMLERNFLNREIEQIKQEASQAMKVKSEFVANVTHELRTPVNGILGNVRELLGGNLEEQTVKSLQLIERCCDDMNKIINNILDFSKLEAGSSL